MGLFNLINKKERNEEKNREDDIIYERLMETDRYYKELTPITEKYYPTLDEIEAEWSIMYNLKSFNNSRAEKFEGMCKLSIALYLQMQAVEKKYGEEWPPSAPAFKRLAMLYEKQNKFEESISICKNAIHNKVNLNDAKPRMLRMIKKAGRMPSDDELDLLD